MSDAKPPSTVDLFWLPRQSAEEWRKLADQLQALRLMLAGLAMRHAFDPSGATLNAGLGEDIAAMQTTVQEAMTSAIENANALGDLAKAIDGQKPPAPAKVLH